MIPHNPFSSTLIKIRTAQKLTPREAAARCNLNYTAYCKIEQGEFDETLEVITALGRGLEVNFLELMGIDLNMIPFYSRYEKHITTEDKEVIRTYGIAVCCKADKTVGGTFTFHYSNLTTQVDELNSLVDWMNQGQLHLIHVEDVIEDYITKL